MWLSSHNNKKRDKIEEQTQAGVPQARKGKRR
jgi:hypothetical protein